MYINRGLLLILLVMFIFAPAIQDWISDNPAAWYRPFIAWAFILLLAFRMHRFNLRKSLKNTVKSD